MKYENIKRAVEISNEISNVSKQIENAKNILAKKSGFVIAEHKDFSGIGIDIIFENGDFATNVYETIIKCTISTLENHLEKLFKEIESL